jgi:hypothetical protein
MNDIMPSISPHFLHFYGKLILFTMTEWATDACRGHYDLTLILVHTECIE